MYSITSAEIVRNLIGAWRIFLRDPNGLAFFETDIAAFWKSFWCAALLFPIYLILVFANPYFPEAAFNDLFRLGAIEVIAYTLGWVAWPVLMIQGSKILGAEEGYLRYIVLYNWSAAPMIIFGLVIAAFEFSQALPVAVVMAISVGFLVWRLIVHSFIFKVTMNVSASKSMPFVIGDFFVGQMILMTKYNMLIGVS